MFFMKVQIMKDICKSLQASPFRIIKVASYKFFNPDSVEVNYLIVLENYFDLLSIRQRLHPRCWVSQNMVKIVKNLKLFDS